MSDPEYKRVVISIQQGDSYTSAVFPKISGDISIEEVREDTVPLLFSPAEHYLRPRTESFKVTLEGPISNGKGALYYVVNKRPDPDQNKVNALFTALRSSIFTRGWADEELHHSAGVLIYLLNDMGFEIVETETEDPEDGE